MPSSKREWRRRIGRVTAYQRGQCYWVYYRQGRQFRQPVGYGSRRGTGLGSKDQRPTCRRGSLGLGISAHQRGCAHR